MRLNINQAAKAVGVARSTLYRDIQDGKVSVGKDGRNKPFVDVSELERVYGNVALSDTSESVLIGHRDTHKKDNKDNVLQREVDLLREQIDLLKDERDDLRHRLDSESEERRKLTMLLTHQTENVEPPKPKEPEQTKSRLLEKLFGRGS
jgi:predicted site-specific integrase-resolvase